MSDNKNNPLYLNPPPGKEKTKGGYNAVAEERIASAKQELAVEIN